MLPRLRAEWARRPWWLHLMLLLCAYMVVVRVPMDVFLTPLERAQEVWFGIVLHGAGARATEPVHWLIYALGAWGFFRMRRWMWPWAAIYAAQIAVGNAVWNLGDPRGAGWAGVFLVVVFLVPAVALWRSRERFGDQAHRTAGTTM